MNKNDKLELENICKKILTDNIINNKMNTLYEEYENSRKYDYTWPLLGLAIGLVAIPFIAPKLSVDGLNGAAAFNNGLARVAGGSLKMGGYGMLGGSTIFAVGGTIIGALFSYSNNIKSYDNFMKTQFHTFQDEITVDKFKICSIFKYCNGVIYFDGPTEIYKDDILIFQGKMYCDTESCEFSNK